jgi:hypothetical protein
MATGMAEGTMSEPVSALIVFSARNVQLDPVFTKNQTLTIGAVGLLARRQLKQIIKRLFGPWITPLAGNGVDKNDPALKFSMPVRSPS